MKPDTTYSLPRLLIGAILIAALALPALAASPPGCPVCGAAVGEHAVVVTDWETNREHRYHDLSCAVREMQTRFPWSRAVTTSAASGQRITLTRISGAWRAQPEAAVALRLAPPQPCEQTLAFADADEARAYRDAHRSQVPAQAALTPLASLPALLAATPAPPAPGAAPGGETDIPSDHWAAEFVARVKALGLMQGYADGTFRGNQPVTRYELAAILARLIEGGY